jgi:ankyrin repeat protein
MELLIYFRKIGFEPESNLANHDGDGLLQLAARYGSCLCIELLLAKYKFMPNRWNVFESATPMHAAAAAGQLVALKMLKEQGGDLECGNVDGKSVLYQAIKSDQVGIVTYLLKHGVKGKTGKNFHETLLHVAAETNHHECVRLLLEDNFPVDAMRNETSQETALHIAASNGYLETVNILLEHKANPDNTNKRNETALHLAAKMHAIPVMQLLLKRDCDVDAKDCDGNTALHCVVNSKDKGGGECIMLLSKMNADLNLRDECGRTALHFAAASRRYNRVRLLIKEGADLCVKNDLGKSALHYIMKYTPSCIKTIEERLDSGIEMDWTMDWTPNTDNDDNSIQNQCSNRVTMDFNFVIPTSCKTGQSQGNDVRLFHEVLKIDSNDPALERILMHPLSLCFLHFKWQQIRIFYFILLFSQFIFSITYSAYVILIYANLCKKDWNVNDKSVVERISLRANCTSEDVVGNQNEWGAKYAFPLWCLLLLFIIFYIVSQINKFLHLKKKYV